MFERSGSVGGGEKREREKFIDNQEEEPPPPKPKWCTAELGRLPDRHGAWPE
jgi:hypothetical protein